MKKTTKKPGRPALPLDQAQTAMIRERVTEAERAKYDRLGGKKWLLAALKRAKAHNVQGQGDGQAMDC